jgi:hypothetical protein
MGVAPPTTRFEVPYLLQHFVDCHLDRIARECGIDPFFILHPPARSFKLCRARAELIIVLRDNVVEYGCRQESFYLSSDVPPDLSTLTKPLSWPKIAYLVNGNRHAVSKAYRTHKGRMKEAA